MLKKMIGILSAGLMIAALMSCAQEKKEPITLHYWTHEDPARTELETKLIAEFEKANPNIKVERTTQGAAKLIELVQTAFAANQGPDIFNLSIEDEYSYVANGRVAPVDPKAAGYADQAAIYDSYLPEILNVKVVRLSAAYRKCHRLRLLEERFPKRRPPVAKKSAVVSFKRGCPAYLLRPLHGCRSTPI